MPAMRIILEALNRHEGFVTLQLICVDIGVTPGRSAEVTISKIAEALNDDLHSLVSKRTESMGVEGWNMLLKTLGRPPRQGYESIRNELRQWAELNGAGGPPLVPAPRPPLRQFSFGDVPVGTVLGGRLTVVEKLGEGGFGAAYKVTSVHPRGTFVAKVADRRSAYQESLQNEYNVANMLGHAHVCRVFRIETDPQLGKVLVLEYGGRSLQQLVTRPWSVAGICRALAPTATALDFLHSRDVVHGDVNPGNILVDSEKHVRLMDFGLSAFLRTEAGHSMFTRVAVGIAGYHEYFSAPEVRAEGRATSRSDQTSLSKVALWMLAGGDPFFENPKIGLRQAAVGRRTKAAIERATLKAPMARYATCVDFVNDLA